MDFIPYKNDKRKTTVLLDNRTITKLDQIALTVDVSRNEIINQCIEFALEHYIKNTSGNEDKVNTLNEKILNDKNSKKNVNC